MDFELLPLGDKEESGREDSEIEIIADFDVLLDLLGAASSGALFFGSGFLGSSFFVATCLASASLAPGFSCPTLLAPAL